MPVLACPDSRASIFWERHQQEPELRRTDIDSETDLTLIDGFVRRHYRLPGVLHLHRHAIGWDLLRAPANIALAPVLLLARLISILAHVLRLRRVSRFAGRFLPQFRSDVGAVLEADLLSDVLAHRGPTDAELDTEAVRGFVRDYVAVRTAVSEIGTALVVLLVGLFVYHAVTPGVISLAPVVTERAAHARDVAGFPLGQWLGGAWYGLFPGERPLWQTLAVGTGLAVALSLVTTFSGILADPLQARLGIHRRRLRRLLRRIDRAAEERPRIEGEFVLARGADIVDVATMVMRFLRS
jgi:hypothetical protein